MFRMRKVASAIAAAALLSTGAFIGIAPTSTLPVANAQETVYGAPVDGIPDSANLHIHKYLGLPGEVRSNGEELVDGPVGDYDPAPGVDFTVYRVNGSEGGDPLDLTDPADWRAAQELQAGGGPDQFFTGGSLVPANVNLDWAGSSLTSGTDGDGTVSFSGLAAGLYLVVEEANPMVGERAIARSTPFLVTVPMTNADRTGWLNDVHIYPKNQAADTPNKRVLDPVPTAVDGDVDLTGSSQGENIQYEISSTIAQLGPNTTYDGYVITDKLDPKLGQPIINSLTLGGSAEPAVDYESFIYQLADGSWVVRVELRGGTLANLHNNVGQDLELTLQALVEDTDGTIDNRAWVLPTNPALGGSTSWDPENPTQSQPGPGTPSNVTSSKYGSIVIDKQDENGGALAGAIFELYRCEAGEDLEVVEGGLPIQVGGETQFTSTGNSENPKRIEGIHLGNTHMVETAEGTFEEDYVSIWDEASTEFCLVEVVAPQRYALLPQPVGVNLEADLDTTVRFVQTASITNVLANAGFALPLTGGSGIWLIIGAGVVLLVVAGGYYIIRKRSDA